MKDIKKTLLNALSDLEKHNVFRNSYFDFLKININRDVYELHRANFFFRTEATVKGIAYVVSQAALYDDMDTLIFFTYILNEECGEGDKNRCHEILMETSHNKYGKYEFGLPSLFVNDAKNNELIIDETHNYRSEIINILSDSYHSMLGCVYALETHADFMLTNFRDAFRANRKKMDVNQYKKNVEIYFNCHVDNGVEKRHATDAKRCVINNCNSDSDLEKILEGAQRMLTLQTNMWDGLYKKVKTLV